MTTKLIDKVVNTEPSGLGFLPPSFKPRPELYPRHASKVANHPQPALFQEASLGRGCKHQAPLLRALRTNFRECTF